MSSKHTMPLIHRPNRTDFMDRFAQSLGISIDQCSFDQATCSIDTRDDQVNALGGVHGGLVFSLADAAFAAACNAGDGTYIGLQAEIRYMGAARSPRLVAKARRVGGSKKFAHYEVVVSDALGNDMALFTGSAYKLSE